MGADWPSNALVILNSFVVLCSASVVTGFSSGESSVVCNSKHHVDFSVDNQLHLL